MKEILNRSEWIWHKKENTPDEYAMFVGHFACSQNEKIILNVSFDTVCNVYVNGQLVFFKKCADYPFYKLYDSIDITEYCKAQNEILFHVWYYGRDNSSYYNASAGLIFEVVQGDEILLSSNEEILCGQDHRYQNGQCKNITHQLGFSFCYDNRELTPPVLAPAVLADKSKTLFLNPLKPLEMLEIVAGQVISQTSRSMLLDLGKETAGFLSLGIESKCEQKITVTYGEHIADGKVRQNIDSRDFSVEIILKSGENRYTNTFRRIAGRYLEIFFDRPINIMQMGIIPVVYPAEQKPFSLQDSLEQQIYDTCVDTLILCRHEHYEDCPWREQAMYIMDSRNQMLCGYYAFSGFEYARHQLVLMSKGVKEGGLLELTYPAKNTPAIPFFSLLYPLAVREYVDYSGDKTVLGEVMPAVEKIMQTFRSLVGENNLIANLPYPYWNFYEWSKGSDNENEIDRTAEETYIPKYDLILNCGYLLALENYQKLKGITASAEGIKQSIHESFYDKEKGLFRADLTNTDLFTELGNSLAILTGVATKEEAKQIAEQLKQNSQMVKVTLSMQCFKYDALLKVDQASQDIILQDIKKDYGYMLSQGATSVWETILGEADFGGAGSLCHGWSAMPIYYFHVLSDRSANV